MRWDFHRGKFPGRGKIDSNRRKYAKRDQGKRRQFGYGIGTFMNNERNRVVNRDMLMARKGRQKTSIRNTEREAIARKLP
jgi:hypothetical protein